MSKSRLEHPSEVRIVEVGPRDGLQNEARLVPADQKVAFVRDLMAAGLRDIEVTSFVSPKAVPQMADAVEVMRELPTADEVIYSALVPNDRGLDRAIEAGVPRIVVFTAASETFTQKNIRMSIDESLRVFGDLARRAIDHGMTVRAYLSACFVCPYEGEVSADKVLEVTRRLIDLGVDEVAISDTIGAAAPSDVYNVVGRVRETVPADRIALHFHDTYGTALANILAGMELGITAFDSSAGGLGGCPFAPGATGNVATEDVIYMMDRMGIETGVDMEAVVDAARGITEHLGRQPESRQARRLAARKGPVS